MIATLPAPGSNGEFPLEDRLEDLLRFETLLADATARFLNVPEEAVDAAIGESLEVIARAFRAERCSVGQFTDDGRSLCWTHGYSTSSAPWPDLQVDFAQELPWYTLQFRERRTLVLPRVLEGLPPEALPERERAAKTGLQSLLSTPLEAGGEVLGTLSVHAYEVVREWEPALVSRLKRLAGVIAGALHRRAAQARLRQAHDLNRSVLESVPVEIVVLDHDGHVVSANEAWKQSARRQAHNRSAPGDVGDYLAALQRAHDQGQVDAGKALEAIRAVLTGASQEARAAYSYLPAHGARRRYVLSVSPRGTGGGVVLVNTDVTELEETKAALEASLHEVQDLKARVEAESQLLHQEVHRSAGFDEIVGTSAALGRVLAQVEQVAPTDAPVLLLGETGTGKDLVARALHLRSSRRERPIVTVNCAALPATLVESELFGYEKGAFTGALQRTIGRFELADGGTLFLDEIGELPHALQAKLLRVLQSGEFERLGSPRTIKVDVRLIAATNRDLEHAMREGTFRSDLYYRLSVFPLTLPPLRDRVEDIPLIVWHFIARRQAKLGRVVKRVPERLMRAFSAYPWPGNVRELENVVERALIMTSGTTLAADPAFLDGAPLPLPALPATASLAEAERAHIHAVLEECGWKVSGKGNAAERLGLNRSTLQFRMHKLGLKRPDASAAQFPNSNPSRNVILE